MEQINIDYSLKNIPIPSNQSFLKCMIEKIESLIRRIRWKAHFFDSNNTENNSSLNFNFGFKSDKTPPQKEHLNAFENDLYDMVRCIQFRSSRNVFQKQLATDIKQIKETDFVLVSADKTTNMYIMSVQEYHKLLTENITKTYKKSSKSDIRKINLEAKSIAKELKLDSKTVCKQNLMLL